MEGIVATKPEDFNAAPDGGCLQRKIDELKDKLCQFKETVTEYENVKRKIDADIWKEAKVVGMTTTGAAKNYELLELLKPRIVVIKEAAEVLESHTVTSIHPGCEHLILIGDHQQLRPNPNVYTLAKRYKLELSLFERMVNNGLRINCLTIQHRMRPCISRLMRHIYLRLDDHPKVSTIENIKGNAKNLFFISHSENEGNKEDSMSHFNEFEKWICKQRDYFSEQETSDAEKELRRQTLLLTLLNVLEHANIINRKEENFPSADREVEPDSKYPMLSDVLWRTALDSYGHTFFEGSPYKKANLDEVKCPACIEALQLLHSANITGGNITCNLFRRMNVSARITFKLRHGNVR
ncbi:NFX1-type zinc finger-containing protein 1-like [Haliotis rubra]|uniref:NFX1-type zinc finger-containing protein 1-like n=1 Tax=Haliotis rubra TaxID=36100 RepID=UPI001EE5C69F|nr:NFX1-type zinc finger-containing protein 1-like [Haliotis rubra]